MHAADRDGVHPYPLRRDRHEHRDEIQARKRPESRETAVAGLTGLCLEAPGVHFQILFHDLLQ